jgi:HEAT repeat protein
VPALRRALTDPDDRVRVAAARSLLDLDDTAGLDGPVGILDATPDRRGAGEIAGSLARMAERHDDLRPRITGALERRLARAVGVDLVGVGVALERLTGERA